MEKNIAKKQNKTGNTKKGDFSILSNTDLNNISGGHAFGSLPFELAEKLYAWIFE